MSRSDSPKREIERHVIRSIRKLADADLVRLLEALRTMTTKEGTPA
ncbi:MAG: hypothetical protein K9L88_07700 [Chromatiaceae bacterium]|nr:hypothetical protein [Chromatiaceae bacterium]